MKKNNDQKPEVIKDTSLIKESNEKESSPLNFDREIAGIKDLSLNHPSERLRTFYKGQYENLLWEREMLLKASRAVLKSAIKGTKKEIEFCYPSLLNWDESRRYYQLRTKRPFWAEMIEYLGKDIKSIKCLCKDGEERTFEIKKIKAFIGYGKKKNSRRTRCVNVYY